MSHSTKGFTLTELLLSIVLIGIITGFSVPLYVGFQSRNQLDVSSQSIASMLRRAQTYARGVKGDSQWGVKVQASNAVLFKGSSFASRDTSYDETTEFPSTITPSGTDEFIFSKLYGKPDVSGNITLSSDSGAIKTVAMNELGTVTY